MNQMERLERMASSIRTAPTLPEMKRRTLSDKGIDGATGAHVIEELHTPLNFAYVTFTTGTTAFQNIVGVTAAEIPGRINAAKRLFDMAGIKEGDKILFTYPPLVNVFSKDALIACGVSWCFLDFSSRDAFLVALYKEKPQIVIGESSFIRAALTDSERLDVTQYLPKRIKILAAGTPLDLELPSVAKRVIDAEIHDLYGCQEIGWITLDGVPLRDDVHIVNAKDSEDYVDLFVGGLPTSDRFLYSAGGHLLNPDGKIITYKRKRLYEEPTVYMEEITANSFETAVRLAKTILRIKGKIIKVSKDIKLGANKNVVSIKDNGTTISVIEKTGLLDALLSAQLDYQSGGKRDATWIKSR